MYKLFLVLFGYALVSCNPGTREEPSQDSTVVATGINDTDTREILNGCYLRVMQRDTMTASLVQDGDTVTGKLVFDNYEKDGSSGTVSGKIDGDILKLIYRFQSEGMNSISEVYFKITSDGIIHGIGDIAVKEDSAFYSAPAQITYQENDKLKRVSCDELK